MSDVSLSIQQALPLRDAGRLADAQRLAGQGDRRAADKFESLLATQLIKEMRRGLDDGFFGSGAGADVFEGWLDEHLGDSLARSGALDLASAIRVSLGQKQVQQQDQKLGQEQAATHAVKEEVK